MKRIALHPWFPIVMLLGGTLAAGWWSVATGPEVRLHQSVRLPAPMSWGQVRYAVEVLSPLLVLPVGVGLVALCAWKYPAVRTIRVSGWWGWLVAASYVVFFVAVAPSMLEFPEATEYFHYLYSASFYIFFFAFFITPVLYEGAELCFPILGVQFFLTALMHLTWAGGIWAELGEWSTGTGQEGGQYFYQHGNYFIAEEIHMQMRGVVYYPALELPKH